MSLFTDIQGLVDESAGAVFWSAEQIYDAANEALLEAAATAPWAEVKASFVVGTASDLVTIPQTVMIPKRIVGTGGTYFPTSETRLEQYSPRWRQEGVAEPRWFVLFDVEHLRAWPPANGEWEFDLYGAAWPTEITASNLDISCDSQLKGAIAHAAAARLLDFTRPDIADQLRQEAERLGKAWEVRLRGRSGHNISRLRPGTVFTKSQHIKVGSRLR